MTDKDIALEEYDKCMATSDCCEECGIDKDLVYEHNHSTGEFRGVLCRQCNTILGLAGDSEDLLRRLADYLKERGTYESK